VDVCTVGHGARPIGSFLEVLAGAGVDTLVDVRRYPGSRRHPQFGREALATAVQESGRRYLWLGEELGGRRRSRPGTRHTALRNEAFAAYAEHMDGPQFRAAVEELIAARDRPAVMCAETLWWHCHRMLIADALVLRGERWIERRLGEPFDLGLLARALAVSERTVIRRFKAALGTTPGHHAQKMKVESAKGLLEGGTLAWEQVCERVGYADASSFRRLFKREVGLPPGEYQARFAARSKAA